MINFVTLFNSNYLSRGLAMYESLLTHCPNFHLYVVAFDDDTFNYFQNFPQKKITAISLKQFEDDKLLQIKSTRSAAEYCWTCTASTVLYAINTFSLEHCIYIDADMCFYSNPQSLIDEWSDKSILLTEHRYTTNYDQSAISGKYCVQFVGFKNNDDGLEALTYWRNACIDWCYARAEDGKFGDQKYLDDWQTRFKNVHVLNHLGGGIAPWNMQQYHFIEDKGKIIGIEKATKTVFDAVFFHFHGLKVYQDLCFSLTGEEYKMNESALKLFYLPYANQLAKVSSQIHLNIDNKFDANGANQVYPIKRINILSLLKWYLYDVKTNISNITGKRTLSRFKNKHYIKL